MITNKMKTVQLKMREARFWPAPQWRGKDKKFQFALKIGWRALAEGEPMTSFSNWRYVFENIRTDFINGLGGRNSPRTPLPPASPCLPDRSSA